MIDHVRTHDNNDVSLEVFDKPAVDNPECDSIQTLLSYLRQSEVGTRAHVIAELVATEGLRVSGVRRLNTEDLDSSLDTLTLPTTDKLSEAEPREVKLSQPTQDALEMYLRYTRVESVDEHPEPLITTPAGRASLSTIRREIRQTSQSVLNGRDSRFSDENPENTQESRVEYITPHQLRRYALDQL
jgi:integrase